MINITNLSLAFGKQKIFDDISSNIEDNQKIGLVGRNGSGKTTLLKIIDQRQGFDSGKINIPKDFKIAYMPQEVVLLSDKTILKEALSTFDNLCEILDELEKLELKIESGEAKDDEIDEYSQLHNKLKEVFYEEKLIETKKTLQGLGFKQNQFNNIVSSLSVGWKMRLILAKLLLQKADFYLFDEPTNHLDIVAKDWFLDFLKNSKFGFILVSHDRYFLDNSCNRIFELSLGKINFYRGNYSKYLIQKEKNKELLEKRQLEQQKEIKKKMEVIQKFRAKATKAKMAQSMLKSLEKIDLIKIEGKTKSVRFNFSEVKRSGKIVLKAKKLSFSFDDKKIFENVSFQIERGQKVAIVAPNGVGKTTLLNIIMGKYKLQHGSIELGYNVNLAFFEQDQNRSLNLNKSILEEVEDSCTSTETRAKVRSYLGAFLFPGDDVYKRIKVLSGGEKNRVAMVKVLLQNANLLILDEPTNHLDLDSKEILLGVLKQYSGTILFVSHDRSFLNNLATNIIDLTPNGAVFYEGNYDSFLNQKQSFEQKKDLKNVEKKDLKNNKKAKLYNNYEQRKTLNRLESKISKQEKELVKETKKLETLEYGTDKYYDSCSKIKDLEQEIDQNMEKWEKLNG
ncbi:ABC-F family ATP-binding cassette domain-containing protein [Candidatus Dependentiae bacterium]